MKLYKDFYDNFVQGDSDFSTLPQLIFICEDERHTAETFKIIVMNRLETDKINLYFTTDLRQNKETLKDTLITYKLDNETNKYKVQEVELNLLGE